MTHNPPPYPAETYYRVSIKALIFDDKQRLLVFVDKNGEWEIPGGGWDHDEDYKACLARELAEEADAKVEAVGPLAFFYRGEAQLGHPKVNLAFRVTLAAGDLTPKDDNLAAVRFVTKAEFSQLPFQKGEASVQDYADQIWLLVEKND